MRHLHHKTLLLAAILVATARQAAGQDSRPAPADARVPDTRPRLAVVDFQCEPGGDERDAWIATALEELLARRLQRVPDLAVIPTIRAYQARREILEPNEPPPPWNDVVRGLGGQLMLVGACHGPDHAVELRLALTRATTREHVARVSLGPSRIFELLDDATRWVLTQLDVPPLDPTLEAALFEPPSPVTSAVEYYARAVSATRADRQREALRYAALAVDADRQFRPALLVLANLELQLGPGTRSTAERRLRVIGDLARLDNDPFDRVRAEIGQALVLQAEGAFDAAYMRAETALVLAWQHRDIYGEFAALTTLCDSFLLRPPPSVPDLPPAAAETYARECLRRAAEWQALLVDALEARGDVLAGLPAANKLALIYERVASPEEALAMHRRTLAMADTLGSRRHQATAWLYLGQWHRSRQSWAEAIDAVTRCLALTHAEARPAVRVTLGGVYRDMGLIEQALTQFEQAYEEVRRGDGLLDQYVCLREIARSRMQLGRRAEAIVALQDAIDLAHALELRDEQDLRKDLERWKSGG